MTTTQFYIGIAFIFLFLTSPAWFPVLGRLMISIGAQRERRENWEKWQNENGNFPEVAESEGFMKPGIDWGWVLWQERE